MYNIRNITEDLIYVGCSDRRLRLFESAYPVPEGVSYNSYLLKDEKTVLFDTVDKVCACQFFENLKAALGDRNLDYLVVQHMEPDHAALIEEVKLRFPKVKIVCSLKAQAMIKQFFNFDIDSCVIPVKEGDTLVTGKHELQFIMAPMVHWPEVMVTYDKISGTLFTADAFGSFGAINGNLTDESEVWNEAYLNEARRYYTNIVGKYGMQVQMLLKKTATLDIKLICPLHGLIIKNNIKLFIEKYNKWSTYIPEEKGVLLAFTSVYGGTESFVEILASKLADKGIRNIKMYDLSFTEHSKVLAEAFKFSHIILASTTYNCGIFDSMKNFIDTLVNHNLQNRKFVLIGNGSWMPTCAMNMKQELEKLKGSEFLTEGLVINSTLKENKLDELDNVVITIEKSLNS